MMEERHSAMTPARARALINALHLAAPQIRAWQRALGLEQDPQTGRAPRILRPPADTGTLRSAR